MDEPNIKAVPILPYCAMQSKKATAQLNPRSIKRVFAQWLWCLSDKITIRDRLAVKHWTPDISQGCNSFN